MLEGEIGKPRLQTYSIQNTPVKLPKKITAYPDNLHQKCITAALASMTVSTLSQPFKSSIIDWHHSCNITPDTLWRLSSQLDAGERLCYYDEEILRFPAC